jgi:hypothetical protein
MATGEGISAKGKAGSTGSSRLLRAVRFCRRRLLLFWGRRLFTVTSWARNSNRAAADAPVELILLHLGVWRLVDAHAVYDFHDHRDLLSSLRNTHPSPPLDLKKQKTDPSLDSKISRNRNAHLYRLGRESTPGNGSTR